MSKEFGKHHNVKDWMFYYKDNCYEKTLWMRLHSVIMKDHQNVGYFGSQKLSKHNSTSTMGMASKVTLHLYTKTDLNQLNRLIDEDLTRNLEAQQYEDDIKASKTSNVWLIQMPGDFSSDQIKLVLKNTSLRYNALSFVFQLLTNNTIEILDAYKITEESNVILKKFGMWSAINGLELQDVDIWSRRRSLEGLHLKVATAYSPPAITFIDNQCRYEQCFQGLFADAWHSLRKRMNFTYTIYKANEWGNLVNGTEWSGMVGMVKKKVVDIAVADLTITRERSTVVHFLQGLMEVEEELFMKNPTDALSLEAYTKPFTILSWIGIFFSVIVVSPIFAIISFYSEGSDAYRLDQCYNFVAQTLILRTSNILPNKDSARIVAGTLLFTGIVIYQCWEASLESMLAIRRPDVPFKTLRGLFKNSRYHLITAKGTVYIDQFKYSKDPFYIKVWNEKMKPYVKDFPLYENLAETTFKNQYSVSYGDLLLKEHELYKTCQIISLGHIIRTSQLAWAIGRESQFKEVFHHNINKLKEIGAIQKYSLAHSKSDQLCKDYGGDPISIKQCASAFFLLIGGICCGLFWFLIEHFIPYSWVSRIFSFGNKESRTQKTDRGRRTVKFGNVANISLSNRNIYRKRMNCKRRQHRIFKSNLQFERKIKNMST